MEITPQIAFYVLLLLPGLLGHAVFGALTYTEKPTWSGRTVVAIVLSAAAYLSLAVLREAPGFRWLPDPQAMLTAAGAGISGTLTFQTATCVLTASVLGVAYSLCLVWSQNHRFLYRLANKLKLTTKSGYVNEWDSVMIEQARSRWVLVAMKDGTSFIGWLKSHDVSSPDRCIVLENVRYQDQDDNGLQWPACELLVINGMEEVRFLRLIPKEGVLNEPAAREQELARVSQRRDQIGESEPKPGTEGASACRADTASFIAGENGQVTKQLPPTENTNV